MLKFLSKVRIEFNAIDARLGCVMEFLVQCRSQKSKESNPACQVVVKRQKDDHPPQITITYAIGVEEVIDASSVKAQDIREGILRKGRQLETKQMFRENGEKWPVLIPEEEIHQSFCGTKLDVYGCPSAEGVSDDKNEDTLAAKNGSRKKAAVNSPGNSKKRKKEASSESESEDYGSDDSVQDANGNGKDAKSKRGGKASGRGRGRGRPKSTETKSTGRGRGRPKGSGKKNKSR